MTENLDVNNNPSEIKNLEELEALPNGAIIVAKGPDGGYRSISKYISPILGTTTWRVQSHEDGVWEPAAGFGIVFPASVVYDPRWV